MTVRWLLILVLALLPLTGCPPTIGDDDDSGDDDDATGDDDDATGDDDDATGDDDDATGDDDDDDDDDDDATGDDDDDDATGDDDDDSGDDDDSAACGSADLTATMEIRDADGNAGTSFTTTDDLTFAGILWNPCSDDVVLTSISTCLVASWSVENSNGMGMGAGVACGDSMTDFTVPADGSLEDTVNWGLLPAETYVGQADFDTPVPPNPTINFTVQ
jgi:hypothetical protein